MTAMKILLVFVAVVAVTIVSACNNYRPRDCEDLYNMGVTVTQTYMIFPEKQSGGIRVRCDMSSGSPGWTTIQFRQSNSLFNLTWDDYENGFGNPWTNHWLGNRYISKLTSQDGYQLRVAMWNGTVAKYADYNHFQVFDARDKYKLLVNGYDAASTANDEMGYHNGLPFTTYDQDNDNYGTNCATSFKGGWWYGSCHRANLNGEWGSTAYGQGLNWFGFTGYHQSLTRVEMKVRRFRP